MKAKHPKTNTTRPRLEALEDRCVPADFSGTISGTAFVDRNANGRFNVTETFLRGAPVHLVGTTTQNVAVNVIATADARGHYKFDNVMPGLYNLSGAPFGGRAARPGLTLDFRNTTDVPDTVIRNVAFGTVITTSISLRQFLNTPTPGSLPVGAAGSGLAKAADRANNKPIAKAGATITPQTLVKNSTANKFVDMAAFFDDVDMTNSLVRFKTSAGNINVELFDRLAPQTVANFLNYVTSNAYDSSIFHRLASGFVLQGGGFTFDADSLTIGDVPDGPTIQNEYSTSNTIGTIAMAKIGGNPNSATNQFFFNLANNSTSLDKDTGPNSNGGFTVFGKIVGSADQTVINALTAFTPKDFTPGVADTPFETVPVKNYTGTATNLTNSRNAPDLTAANLAMINDVEVVKRPEKLTYSIVSNAGAGGAASPVTAVFVNNQLKVNAIAGASGTATVTIRATDKFGATVDRAFTFTINNNAPTATATLLPVGPTVSATDTLTATVTPADPDGDPVLLTYEWTIDGVVVQTTSNTASTTDQLNLTGRPQAVSGATVKLKVTPSDGTAGAFTELSRTIA